VPIARRRDAGAAMHECHARAAFAAGSGVEQAAELVAVLRAQPYRENR
jgi:hypothetical protein